MLEKNVRAILWKNHKPKFPLKHNVGDRPVPRLLASMKVCTVESSEKSSDSAMHFYLKISTNENPWEDSEKNEKIFAVVIYNFYLLTHSMRLSYIACTSEE